MLSEVPLIRRDEAEAVAEQIKKRWHGITGQAHAPEIAREAWADLVQNVWRFGVAMIEARQSAEDGAEA